MGVKFQQSGFAPLEGILLVVIVAAIVGVGAFVLHQKHGADKTLSKTNSSAEVTAPAGTTASVDQLTEQDAKTEANIDTSADGTAQQDAVSANGAVSNVGGAYNEANY